MSVWRLKFICKKIFPYVPMAHMHSVVFVPFYASNGLLQVQWTCKSPWSSF